MAERGWFSPARPAGDGPSSGGRWQPPTKSSNALARRRIRLRLPSPPAPLARFFVRCSLSWEMISTSIGLSVLLAPALAQRSEFWNAPQTPPEVAILPPPLPKKPPATCHRSAQPLQAVLLKNQDFVASCSSHPERCHPFFIPPKNPLGLRDGEHRERGGEAAGPRESPLPSDAEGSHRLGERKQEGWEQPPRISRQQPAPPATRPATLG